MESLSALVQSGELTGCEYLNVESEFAAMSAAIGASAAGARAYTATASQGCCSWSRRSTTHPAWACPSS